MKNKLIKNKIFILLFIGIILGVLITGGIRAVAVTLAANQVTYTSNDSSFSAKNVKEAVDKLYELSATVSAGAYTILPYVSGSAGSNNQTYSATSIKNYQKLTAANFVYVTTGITSWTSHENDLGYVQSVNLTPTISYDASTGIVSVTGTYSIDRNTYGYVHTTASGEVRFYN